MPSPILANFAGSISELKKNPMALVLSGDGEAVAILNHNKPAFYCIPAEAYEQMVEHMEDLRLAQLVREREDEESIPVSLNEL
jgi:antitoxin StbD